LYRSWTGVGAPDMELLRRLNCIGLLLTYTRSYTSVLTKVQHYNWLQERKASLSTSQQELLNEAWKVMFEGTSPWET